MSRHLAVELLSSYMDEEVSPTQLRLVESHLSECSDCRGRLAGLRAVAAGVRRLEAVAPPPALAAAVERRVRLASQEETAGSWLEAGLKRWAGQPVLAPAFAVILALGAILYMFAFGVSKSGPQRTRLVVAAAPAEDDLDALEKRDDSRLNSAPVPEAGLKDGAAVAPPPARSARVEPPVAPAQQPAEPEQTSPAPRAEEPGRRVASERQKMSAKLSTPREQSAAVGSVATSGKVEESEKAELTETQVMLEDSFAAQEAEVRELAGRRFVRDGELWIETGLSGESVARVLDLRQEAPPGDGELAPFESLERVRLRIGDEVVEVIFPQRPR